MCRYRASNTSWFQWLVLYGCLALAPDLFGAADPIPYLQIFLERVCMCILVADISYVCKSTVEGYLRYVTHLFSSVVASDPLLGQLDCGGGSVNYYRGRGWT